MWRERLRTRYPVWTASLVRSFDVGDGWRGLTEGMFNNLDARLGGEAGCTALRIEQVKEKFGLLRVYLRDAPQEAQADVRAILDRAVRMSSVTCEVCGGPGTLIKGQGWLRVRCPAMKSSTLVMRDGIV